MSVGLEGAVQRGLGLWWEIPAHEWRLAHTAALAAGYARCEWVTAAHLADMRLVSHLSGPAGVLVLATSLGGQVAESVADLYPSASYHEREVSQMFGVTFAGTPDGRPAFAADFAGHPLRRDFPLANRMRRTWPGESEPEASSRRRPASPPGVHPEWSP